MTKKKTPLLNRRESIGLSLITRLRRVATFSTKIGSNVKSNWTTCGKESASLRIRFTLGRGRITDPSLSRLGKYSQMRIRRLRIKAAKSLSLSKGEPVAKILHLNTATFCSDFQPSSPCAQQRLFAFKLP